MDVLALSGEQLLKQRAATFFATELGSVEAYRKLVKRWHPDASSDPLATQVFAHVTSMYQDAKRAWVHGTYPNTLTVQKTVKGKIEPVHYPYISASKFELGELYVCERHVIWAARRDADDLAKRQLDVIKTYKYPNEALKAKIEPFIPHNAHVVANGDRSYTIMDRRADYVRLADLLAKKGDLGPAHAAWILSRAYKLASWLEFCSFTHADITPESFFIEPATHYGALLGGWFYTAKSNQKLLAAPGRTAHLVKTPSLHDAQIRLMGRRILGITSPIQLRMRTDVNEPLKSWLMGTPLVSLAEAFYRWNKVLIDTFGKKRFTELNVTTAEVYSV